MGEAKRRRATALQYCDLITGEPYAAKDGGDVEAYLDRWGRNERPPVPCNGCTTCCYHSHVDVYPDQERPEDLSHMSTFSSMHRKPRPPNTELGQDFIEIILFAR
jgi:hypothetical protein